MAAPISLHQRCPSPSKHRKQLPPPQNNYSTSLASQDRHQFKTCSLCSVASKSDQTFIFFRSSERSLTLSISMNNQMFSYLGILTDTQWYTFNWYRGKAGWYTTWNEVTVNFNSSIFKISWCHHISVRYTSFLHAIILPSPPSKRWNI